MEGIKQPGQIFIGLITLGGLSMVTCAALERQPWHAYQFLLVLVIAVLASRLKLKLPGLNGNMSVNLPFILIAQAQLSPTEALIIACTSTLVQSLPRAGAKLKPVQVLFNISTMAIAVESGCLVLHHGQHLKMIPSGALLLALSAGAFFLGQTLPVSAIVALTDGGAFRRIWTNIAQMSFPYYVVSAGVTSMVNSVGRHIGWPTALLLLSVMYGIYRSYRLYFAKAAQAVSQPMAMRAAVGAHS
jgi:hypothetical protein